MFNPPSPEAPAIRFSTTLSNPVKSYLNRRSASVAVVPGQTTSTPATNGDDTHAYNTNV